MTRIAFIGLGNMGGPMAANLVKAGHEVLGFDLVAALCEAAARNGVAIVANAADAVSRADVAITMLPAGKPVVAVWSEIVGAAKRGVLLIDSSTIDVESARRAHALAQGAGLLSIDAPVSGGVGGAKAASLTFMCGGAADAFTAAKPILEKMGQAHRPLRRSRRRAGGENLQQYDPGRDDDRHRGSLRARREARPVASGAVRRRLDLVGPELVADELLPRARPGSGLAGHNGYKPGFAAALMLKDLKLAQEAALAAGATTPLGAEAAQLYALFNAAGHAGDDFSGIINFLRGAK